MARPRGVGSGPAVGGRPSPPPPRLEVDDAAPGLCAALTAATCEWKAELIAVSKANKTAQFSVHTTSVHTNPSNSSYGQKVDD